MFCSSIGNPRKLNGRENRQGVIHTTISPSFLPFFSSLIFLEEKEEGRLGAVGSPPLSLPPSFPPTFSTQISFPPSPLSARTPPPPTLNHQYFTSLMPMSHPPIPCHRFSRSFLLLFPLHNLSLHPPSSLPSPNHQTKSLNPSPSLPLTLLLTTTQLINDHPPNRSMVSLLLLRFPSHHLLPPFTPRMILSPSLPLEQPTPPSNPIPPTHLDPPSLSLARPRPVTLGIVQPSLDLTRPPLPSPPLLPRNPSPVVSRLSGRRLSPSSPGRGRLPSLRLSLKRAGQESPPRSARREPSQASSLVLLSPFPRE